MMAALCCSNSCSVTIITDGKLGSSNSLMAQGGIQIPNNSDKDRTVMLEDMLKSSRGLASRDKILNFVNNIDQAMKILLDLGVKFDRHKDGTLIRRLAGGLSSPRIISSTDKIGPVVINALRRKVLSSKNIKVLQKCQVADFQVVDDGIKKSFRISLRFLEKNNLKKNIEENLESFTASTVVCSTGGKTFDFAKRFAKRTTNPSNKNHKMYELLEKIGFEEKNKDLYQYQPFGIVIPSKMRGKNIPETITNFSVEILDKTTATVWGYSF